MGATTTNNVYAWMLANPGPHGPTEIGVAMGYKYVEASGKICPHLKALVKEGKIRQTKPRGPYEVIERQV